MTAKNLQRKIGSEVASAADGPLLALVVPRQSVANQVERGSNGKAKTGGLSVKQLRSVLAYSAQLSCTSLYLIKSTTA